MSSKTPFNISIKAYYKSGLIDSPINVNSTTFVNNGTATCLINNVFLLGVGDTLKIEGNENEIDTTKYRLTFETGAGGMITVFTKQYNKE